MEKFNRRKLLKLLGTSGALLTGTSGTVTADSTEMQRSASLEIQTEDLRESEITRHYEQARSKTPVLEVLDFLETEKSYKISDEPRSGVRVEAHQTSEHVILDVPLTSDRSYENLNIRIFDDSVAAEALVNGVAYRSNRTIVDDNLTSATSESNQNVVTALEWNQRHDSLVTTNAPSCWQEGTFDAGRPACRFLQAITVIAGGVLMLVPEPSSTAVGAVGISTVLSGGCEVADLLDDHIVGSCEITKIGICVTYPSITSPIPDVLAYPVDCV